MDRNRAMILGIVIGLAGLAVGVLVAWAAFSISSTRRTVMVQPPPAAPASVENRQPTEPAKQDKPGEVVIESDPDMGMTWETLKLPRAASRDGGPPKIHPDQPEPPLADTEVVCPMIMGNTLNQDRPDECCNWEIVARTIESHGLIRFDLSPLKEVPKKAVLRGCIYHMENGHNYLTPLKLVFYRMKTDWDDSATFRFANARDQVKWANGDYFNHESPADVDLTPVASVVIPNPPKPGFNVQVDITPIVQAWIKGQHPNRGLLVHCDFKLGWSHQGNLATRKYTIKYLPQILCTVSTPQARTAAPVERNLASLLSSFAPRAGARPELPGRQASTQPTER